MYLVHKILSRFTLTYILHLTKHEAQRDVFYCFNNIFAYIFFHLFLFIYWFNFYLFFFLFFFLFFNHQLVEKNMHFVQNPILLPNSTCQ